MIIYFAYFPLFSFLSFLLSALSFGLPPTSPPPPPPFPPPPPPFPSPPKLIRTNKMLQLNHGRSRKHRDNNTVTLHCLISSIDGPLPGYDREAERQRQRSHSSARTPCKLVLTLSRSSFISMLSLCTPKSPGAVYVKGPSGTDAVAILPRTM